MKKLFLSGSLLLSMSVEENLNPTMDLIGERLHMDEDELAIVVYRSPTLLYVNFTRSNGPKYDWYQERMNLTTAQLSNMVKRQPAILTYNIETKIKPTVQWLKRRIRTDERLTHLLFLSPSILSLRTSNLAPKFDFLFDAFGKELAEGMRVSAKFDV